MKRKTVFSKSLRALSALFALLLLLSSLPPIFVEAFDSGDIAAPYAAVYNTQNSVLIFGKHENQKVAPAGVAKLICGIIALEKYGDSLDSEITVTRTALAQIVTGSAILGLKAGEVVTAEDLIYTLLIGGCADSAYALAFDISGSVTKFVIEMNKKASQIGATSTSFANPCGSDDAAAYTTAADAALIAAYALRLPLLPDIVNTVKYTVPASGIYSEHTVWTRNYMISNHNQYEYMYSGASGINVSRTAEAGDCVITSISVRGLTYICVVIGGTRTVDGKITAYSDAKKLLNYAKTAYSYITVLGDSTVICEIPVTLARSQDYAVLVPTTEFVMFLPSDTDIKADISYEYTLISEAVEAPVKAGDILGSVRVLYRGEVVTEIPLTAKLDIHRSEWLSFTNAIGGFFGNRIFKIFVLLAVLLFIGAFLTTIFLIFKKANKKRRY